MKPSSLIVPALVWLALISIATPSRGQTRDSIRRNFADIRDDKIPHNAEKAIEWLLSNREELKTDLLNELYKTDRQGRDAILHVLFNTASFVPDERFMRLVLARLPEENTYVGNGDLFPWPQSDEKDQMHALGVHWEGWKYIHNHFDAFEPLLKEEIGKSDKMFVPWGCAWLAKKRGLLQNYSTLFTPEVLEKAASNLRDDTTSYNASMAVRLFLLLGDQSLPVLKKAATSGDSQARNLARATMDALAGKRRGFGYLNAKLKITTALLGDDVEDPEWLPDATAPFLENEEKPY